jgi:hypothetical protein
MRGGLDPKERCGEGLDSEVAWLSIGGDGGAHGHRADGTPSSDVGIYFCSEEMKKIVQHHYRPWDGPARKAHRADGTARPV